MTDTPTSHTSTLSPTAHFSTRLAAHLADVQNADKAHRLIRSESDQKVEALTRMVAEQQGRIEALERRLPNDLRDLMSVRAGQTGEAEVVALAVLLSGSDEEPEAGT